MDQTKELQKVFEEFSPMLDSWWPYVIGLIMGIAAAIRSYMGGNSCPSEDRIDGKIVVITGATSGIGKVTAFELAKRGGHVILAVRDIENGAKVADEIKTLTGAKAEVRMVDLSSLKSVRDFADKLEVNEVDILVNNAGIAFHPYEKTEENFEMHFVTNYLGHFLLTQLLLPKLEAAKQGRIINVTAQAYSTSSINLEDLNLENNYSARQAFGQSKLALVMMTIFLSGYLKDSNVTCNSVNPGLVRGTRHMRSSPIEHGYFIKFIMYPWLWLCLKNPLQGAQTTIYAAVSKDLDETTGEYLSDCEIKKTAISPNDSIVKQLYAKSMLLVKPYLRSTKLETQQTNLDGKTIVEES
ncbi:retinol dehydrogenase 13-like isoform X2 [Venturia canescens]|uniref:retinol dehydrogenase 13-like isoform X2 n=1 Tax=Venturia canescens TaxID=32260 RepID=UPI001C9BC62D|nr:retinol dehydrogenase 13-like isoform X2 [Venturia canescens]